MVNEKKSEEEIIDSNVSDNTEQGGFIDGIITIVTIVALIVLSIFFGKPVALKVSDGLCFDDRPFYCDFAAKYLADTEEKSLDYYVRACGCNEKFKTDKYIKKGCHEAGLIFEKRWRRQMSMSNSDDALKNIVSAIKYFKVSCDSHYESSCIKLDLIVEELKHKNNNMNDPVVP